MEPTPIRTIWFDETGSPADLHAKVGRLGNDIRCFALHSLGWVRICEMMHFREIEFDPAAVRPATMLGLVAHVRACDLAGQPWVTRAASYTGREWMIHQSTDADDLITWLERVHEFGQPPVIPCTIQVQGLGNAEIENDRDPILTGVLEAWRSQSGQVEFSPSSTWTTHPWGRAPGVSVKVMMQDPHSSSFLIMSYQASLTTLWSSERLQHFTHARITEQMPDRALAADVVRSATRVLTLNRPVAEWCEGPVRRSDGRVEHVEWKRISVPARTAGSRNPNAVIVYCRRRFAEQRRTA